MYAQLPRPAIFAHRGASAYAPENTLAAFDLAIRQNADAIELDAKLSADGHVVIIHDQTVDRTTDGTGRVSDLQLAALQELDAGCTYDEAFRHERIPTLGEVFDAVGRKILINVELTNYLSPKDALPEKVAELVRQHDVIQHVMFSSFNPLALRRIHRQLPDVSLGLLAFRGAGGAWARSRLGRWVPYQALHPAAIDTCPRLIQQQQARGFRVHTYTVNNPEDMRRFFEWGIDGIFTSDPLLAQRVLATVT
ncbi:MAG: glycerophosphodiester phosphodiesterase family protein [Chloroflexota bacterium]